MSTKQINGAIIAAAIGFSIIIFSIINPFGWFGEKKAAPCPQLDTEAVVGTPVKSDSLIHMYESIAASKAEKAIQGKLAICKNKGDSLKIENDKLKTKNAKLKTADKKLRIEIDALKKKLNLAKAFIPAIKVQKNNITIDTLIATNSLVGDVIGDAGCTFDTISNLFFYVKTSLLNSIGNRTQDWSNLNDKSGPKGEEVGVYTYYRTPMLVLKNMLDREWVMSIYVGDNTQYGYDMWLWHELVKLNTNLKNQSEIQDNNMGGYKYISKVNYHSK